MAAVVPEQVADKGESEVSARDRSGPTRAGDAECGKTKLAKDEDVIAQEIDEIGGEQSEGDGAHHVHALESAANGEIKHEREKADGEGAHVGKGQDGNIVRETHSFKVKRNEPNGESEEG